MNPVIEQNPAHTSGEPEMVLVISASQGWVGLKLKELWHYRELLYFLTWRDIKVRYKQTLLGAVWAILQPLLTMLIFSLVFGRLAKIPSDGIPYPLFSMAALVPWTLFSFGLTQSSQSLVMSSNMVKKIYFPRLAIPIATVLSGLVDFVLALGILTVMVFSYGVHVGPRVLWLPAFILLTVVISLGVGLWLSAVNVKYRDVRYAVPFLVQFWMYGTPIAYSSTMLHEPWRTLFGLNPMAGVVEGFRWALLGAKTAPGPMVAVSSAMSVVILLAGAFYFRRMEKHFADML
jgi:lipopolysaccharide transport system permease protein